MIIKGFETKCDKTEAKIKSYILFLSSFVLKKLLIVNGKILWLYSTNFKYDVI